ncbi:MAG: tRNA (N(6)-L-threonylcarbamoyladenosine(37)-C(2))-methylthiotransferase, partial [Thermoplasmata archaeon]|nr:tRNA (N(6)-L-threonylcarbamoyladenosine(37)-C(2))-methylthiotransferase [Thermoplasmata archaeon]
GACSYCITKVARPRLRSYRPELIVENVKRALAMGYREIRLTAPDTAAYGRDIGSSLPELLEMVAGLEGDFMVRVGMMNPNTASRIWDDLMKVYSHPRVFKFLHLPVQSGDDGVLRDMRRGYTVEEFEELVRDFRSRHEGLLSTDVIVGYPTEDEEAFRNTVELVGKVRPDILNITRFSRRPGTPAWRLKPLPSQELKRRSRLLTELHRRISLENNSRFVGRRMRVLVLEEGKGGTVLARAPSYRPVVLDAAHLGEWVEAEIVDYSFVYLRGRRVAD